MQKKQTNPKKFIVFCEPCSFKQIITSGEDVDLNSIPLSKVPGGAPKIDPVTKKTTEVKSTSRNKAFKCPKCGRGIVSKKLPEVYVKTIKDLEKKEEEKNDEQERQQRIRDGLLPEKPKFDPKLEIKKREAD